ncbi:MAG: glycosyltransferase family 4 protein, partial [Ferruginibacter sp.]
MMDQRKLVFLCGARDFHAMDWYKSANENLENTDVLIITDLIAGEGFEKIITSKDKVFKLIILDKFLFHSQSSLGNMWRNLIKLLVLPIQVILLKKFYKKHRTAVFHAHSMYYLWMAWLAEVPFVGTPQGSDILIKPYKSKIFKWLSLKSMRSAIAITVDSEKMKEGVINIAGVPAHVIQNGIDIQEIEDFFRNVDDLNRECVLSIRGFTPLYRLNDIVHARNESVPDQPITFIYPFYENNYRDSVSLKSIDH